MKYLRKPLIKILAAQWKLHGIKVDEEFLKKLFQQNSIKKLKH